jgi:hypothetical protein
MLHQFGLPGCLPGGDNGEVGIAIGCGDDSGVEVNRGIEVEDLSCVAVADSGIALRGVGHVSDASYSTLSGKE